MSNFEATLNKVVHFCDACNKACHVGAVINTERDGYHVEREWINEKPNGCKYCGYSGVITKCRSYGKSYTCFAFPNSRAEDGALAHVKQEYELFAQKFNDGILIIDNYDEYESDEYESDEYESDEYE